ncbi:acyl-CoA carboxylase subunit epsilon [Thermasporomyces composti]|jgi:hypothetical protein|uniref:Acyl-CoA carboxylase epsilon subunit-like protein n=1 Tax=Thermasporomyces composti TaxID=696763 RepID=A0A3D9VED6_THECX|nr:acyl-CoA carboxylase subunit epsilon [Thermasporomyces composti]REF37475.1 acyl-CoA carboxylase epsilon subunit-like protein [Thermasporomyces composti]
MAVDEPRPTGQPRRGEPRQRDAGVTAEVPTSPAEAERDALLRVVKGTPTPEEFAALVAVISAKLRAARSVQPSGTRGPSPWAVYWRRARQPLRPGPNAWRASALPR